MAKYTTLNALFTAIANALRGKTGSTGKIVADDFPSVIDSLSTGGITPSGTKNITTNGEHDVTSFAKASVNVPVGTTPSGTKTITTNGTHDVTNYASAEVNVPTGITPSGSINITANGTHNVTNYASAVVAVPTPEQMTVVRTVTVSADVTGAKNYQMLSGDEFIKKHYADEGFSATLVPVTPPACATNVVTFNHQGNRNVGASDKAYYGAGFRCSSATALTVASHNTKINGKGYSQHMRVDSTGALYQYLHTNYILKAGTYHIILTCTT